MNRRVNFSLIESSRNALLERNELIGSISGTG
jgi:hypothetical protein